MTIPHGPITLAVFEGPGKLRLQQVNPPTLNTGELLVEVLGCTLCGSDLHSFTGRREVAVPTVLGHEIAGRVVAIGTDGQAEAPQAVDGKPLTVGDRVVWAVVASCGSCDRCLRGFPQKCRHGVKYGHAGLAEGREPLGGLGSHCLLLSGTSIVRLPESLPLEVACPAGCATATVAAALESAGDLTGLHVGVFGLGMLGLTACAMAREAGAEVVVGIDPDARRGERSKAFGATAVARPDELFALLGDPSVGGFDLVLEMSGSPAAVTAAIDSAGVGASIHLVGSVFPAGSVPLDPEQVVRRQLAIRGTHNYAPRHLQQAVAFLERCHSRHPFASLVESWVPLVDVGSAFERAMSSGAVRIGVRP
jgi:putative phosphonate catabolism associated alcohol dehydrogenase